MINRHCLLCFLLFAAAFVAHADNDSVMCSAIFGPQIFKHLVLPSNTKIENKGFEALPAVAVDGAELLAELRAFSEMGIVQLEIRTESGYISHLPNERFGKRNFIDLDFSEFLEEDAKGYRARLQLLKIVETINRAVELRFPAKYRFDLASLRWQAPDRNIYRELLHPSEGDPLQPHIDEGRLMVSVTLIGAITEFIDGEIVYHPARLVPVMFYGSDSVREASLPGGWHRASSEESPLGRVFLNLYYD